VLITVSAFREPYEAHLLRGRLEAEGVPAFVVHEYYIANDWTRSLALGGVKVQVHRDFYGEAREVELACRNGEFRALLQEAEGDLDDPACPACGRTAYRKRLPVQNGALAIAALFMLGIVVPPTGWIYRCEGCLKEYPAPHRPLSLEKCQLVAALMVGAMLGILIVLRWIHSAFGCPYGYGCL